MEAGRRGVQVALLSIERARDQLAIYVSVNFLDPGPLICSACISLFLSQAPQNFATFSHVRSCLPHLAGVSG